jgi:hypothetical protein
MEKDSESIGTFHFWNQRKRYGVPVALVTTQLNDEVYCKIRSRPLVSDTDASVEVKCFDGEGTPTNGRFMVAVDRDSTACPPPSPPNGPATPQ